MSDYIRAKHWSEVTDWPDWCVYFSPPEVACKGTREVLQHVPTLRMMHDLRVLAGRPIIVTSAYRSPEHNRAVGGARHSQHVEGRAFDIRMDNHDPHEFERLARQVGFTGFGFYPESRNGFMHIDTGPARVWGTRWPATAREFDAPPVRERTPSLIGTLGAIGGAAVAATPELVEVVHTTAAEVERAQGLAVWWLAVLGVGVAAVAGGYAAWTIVQRRRQEAVE